ncbi:MAG: hypothetical protein JWM21_1816 [Acidobacteria bacterium]|nr:hypothetical protein [Acidobacteriota bacterium]
MSSKALALAFCLLALSLAAHAQEGRPRQLIVPLTEGGFVAFQAETAFSEATKRPDGQQARANFDSQALIDDKQVIHRVLVDTEGKPIFGYDLLVEANSTLKQFKVTARPLDNQFESKLVAHSNSGPLPQPAPQRISTLPQSSESQLLDDGDAFALDLLINADTGIKIVDVVKVSFDRATFWNNVPKSLPRDFTLDAVQLSVKEYQLLINDAVVATGKSKTGCAGALIWFYVPDHGRFIFSLVPREGYQFQKVGLVADNKIEFTVNGDRYEWISSGPVLRDGGAWNLWVLHDPKYTPLIADAEEVEKKGKDPWDKLEAAVKSVKEDAGKLGNQKQTTFQKNAEKNRARTRPARVMVGGADRIENLLPK